VTELAKKVAEWKHDAKGQESAGKNKRSAVNLGDDADTKAAIHGRAYRDTSRIPKEWRDGLARSEMIEKVLQGLLGGKQ
jgi:ADP-ribosylglycohydrolase